MKKENIIEINYHENLGEGEFGEPEIEVIYEVAPSILANQLMTVTFRQDTFVDFLCKNYDFKKVVSVGNEGKICIRQGYCHDTSDHEGKHIQETGTWDSPVNEFMDTLIYDADKKENSQELEMIVKFINARYNGAFDYLEQLRKFIKGETK